MRQRRFLVAAMGMAAGLALSAVPVLASDSGYHQNPNSSAEGQCHGAFGAFSHNFAFSSFVPPVDAHQDFGTHGGGSANNPNAEKSVSGCG